MPLLAPTSMTAAPSRSRLISVFRGSFSVRKRLQAPDEKMHVVKIDQLQALEASVLSMVYSSNIHFQAAPGLEIFTIRPGPGAL
jgi:hypothetical protein